MAARRTANTSLSILWSMLAGGLLGRVLLIVVVSVLAYVFSSMLGVPGLIVLSAILLAAIVGVMLAHRFPVGIFVFWLVSMSGLHTLGMLRMPGIPDFSFPRLLMIALLILLPLGVIYGRPLIKPPLGPDLFIVTYTVYVFINMMIIGDPHRFHTWMQSVFSPLLAYLFAKQVIQKDSHIRALLLSFVLISIYFWITSFGEHFEIESMVWPRVILDRDFGNSWMGRSRGPFVQPAVFGQIIGMYIIVHLYFLTRKINYVWKILIVVNVCLSSLGLYYTYTRGGWLATIAGLAVLFVLRPRFRKMLFAFALVGIVFGATGLMTASNDEFLSERMENTNTIENRLGFLAAATRMIGDSPIYGVGYFKFTALRHLYNQGTYIPFYGFVKKGAGAEVSIHDIYIGRAAEEGMLGLILFLAFFVVIAKEYIRFWKLNPQGQWMDRDGLAMNASLFVAYLVGALLIDYRFFEIINCLPMLFAGIIVGYRRPDPVLDGTRM